MQSKNLGPIQQWAHTLLRALWALQGPWAVLDTWAGPMSVRRLFRCLRIGQLYNYLNPDVCESVEYVIHQLKQGNINTPPQLT